MRLGIAQRKFEKDIEREITILRDLLMTLSSSSLEVSKKGRSIGFNRAGFLINRALNAFKSYTHRSVERIAPLTIEILTDLMEDLEAIYDLAAEMEQLLTGKTRIRNRGYMEAIGTALNETTEVYDQIVTWYEEGLF